METPNRFDYLLIAILLSASYAVSNLAGKEYDVYLGIWMLIVAFGISLWFLNEGMSKTGKLINLKIPNDGKKEY